MVASKPLSQKTVMLPGALTRLATKAHANFMTIAGSSKYGDLVIAFHQWAPNKFRITVEAPQKGVISERQFTGSRKEARDAAMDMGKECLAKRGELSEVETNWNYSDLDDNMRSIIPPDLM